MIPIRLHIAESNFVVREGLKSVFGAEGNIDLVGITAKPDQLKSELMDSSPNRSKPT